MGALKNSSYNPTVIQDVGTGKGTGWYTATGTTVIDENGNVVGPVIPGAIALPSAQLLVGNASNVAAPVAVTGDVTISNAGVTAIGANKVTGAKLVTGVGYFSVAVNTNGTTPVNVFGATVPFSGTITSMAVIASDTTAGTVTLADTAGTVGTIAKGGTAGVMTGATSLANTTVTLGNTLTVVSSSAGNATVLITFTTA